MFKLVFTLLMMLCVKDACGPSSTLQQKKEKMQIETAKHAAVIAGEKINTARGQRYGNQELNKFAENEADKAVLTEQNRVYSVFRPEIYQSKSGQAAIQALKTATKDKLGFSDYVGVIAKTHGINMENVPKTGKSFVLWGSTHYCKEDESPYEVALGYLGEDAQSIKSVVFVINGPAILSRGIYNIKIIYCFPDIDEDLKNCHYITSDLNSVTIHITDARIKRIRVWVLSASLDIELRYKN